MHNRIGEIGPLRPPYMANLIGQDMTSNYELGIQTSMASYLGRL